MIFTARLSLGIMMTLAALIEGGNAFVMMPAVTLGANALPDELITHGTAVITTVRQILGSAGVTVATLILSNVTHQQLEGVRFAMARITGYRMAFLTFFVVSLFGLLLAGRLKEK